MKDFLAHFGFRETPFTRELRVDQHYSHPQFTEATEALLGAIEHRFSSALIAPSGTGKTNVLRRLTSLLPEARFRIRYVKVTDLGRRDLCREICTALGTDPAGSFPFLLRRLQERFATCLDTDGLRPVLLLDEAHELRPDVLGMLRVLTNFEMDSRLVVSIVLAGQPPLRNLLRRDDLEDVARRLNHIATLVPLSRQEMHDYVKHRCFIAGARSTPFDGPAMEALFETGRGNLRATDALTLKSLELAHQNGAKVASPNHVAEARTKLFP